MRRILAKGIYAAYCKHCEEQVTADVEDGSFAHEFGIEHVYSFSCSQCHEPVASEDVDFIEWD